MPYQLTILLCLHIRSTGLMPRTFCLWCTTFRLPYLPSLFIRVRHIIFFFIPDYHLQCFSQKREWPAGEEKSTRRALLFHLTFLFWSASYSYIFPLLRVLATHDEILIFNRPLSKAEVVLVVVMMLLATGADGTRPTNEYFILAVLFCLLPSQKSKLAF